MKNNLENQDIKTDKPVPMSYEALKADRDALEQRVNALAIENAALKDGFEWLYTVVSSDAVSVPDEKYSAVTNAAAVLSKTPATEAALAAIRLQSKIEGVEAAANRVGIVSLQYKPGQKQELIKAIGRDVLQYAHELREAK